MVLFNGWYKVQSWTKYLEQNREIQYNWTGQEKIDISICGFFDCYCQSLISRRGTGHWAMSPPRFEIFLIFPYCRQRTKYCSVYKLESQKAIHMIGYVSGIEIANHLRFAKTPLLLLHGDSFKYDSLDNIWICVFPCFFSTYLWDLSKLTLVRKNSKNSESCWNYNPGHNTLRHFDVWQNFRVATSEANRDY